ncbi:hypothetical protein [Streptomyces sp.]|uniref:hypothetical protein n=1 Tax=Streptomyces sp. TaxID=1931 RepID=UPI002D769B67|nr:hypothetical protein [Streptomyces sp.]HET6355415.1 hypothetical protein [Streptomyces sp.]
MAVPVDGVAETDRDARTVTEFEGNTEEAETALVRAADTFEHSIWKVRRREIFKCSSRCYFIRIQGRLATYGFLIQLAELIHDSDVKPVVQPFAVARRAWLDANAAHREGRKGKRRIQLVNMVVHTVLQGEQESNVRLGISSIRLPFRRRAHRAGCS